MVSRMMEGQCAAKRVRWTSNRCVGTPHFHFRICARRRSLSVSDSYSSNFSAGNSPKRLASASSGHVTRYAISPHHSTARSKHFSSLSKVRRTRSNRLTFQKVCNLTQSSASSSSSSSWFEYISSLETGYDCAAGEGRPLG